MLKQNTISFVFNATATATILVVVDLDPNWSPPSSPTREEFSGMSRKLLKLT